MKLEKFDAASKAKIIREVKAIMPNMNLVEVCRSILFRKALAVADCSSGQEIRRVCTQGSEGERTKGRGRKTDEYTQRTGCNCCSRMISTLSFIHTFWRAAYNIPFFMGPTYYLISEAKLYFVITSQATLIHQIKRYDRYVLKPTIRAPNASLSRI